MGQYYTPVIIRDNKISTYSPHDYDNGAKIMEHSFIGNWFTETVLKELLNNKGHLAWVGDYAHDREEYNTNDMLSWMIAIERKEEKYRKQPTKITQMENSFMMVFINHTKKEYIDIEKYTFKNGYMHFGFIIHPIPLLTAMGNGLGGGDYRGKNMKLVGSWAGDEIEMTDWPSKEITENYKDISKEIIFKEGKDE